MKTMNVVGTLSVATIAFLGPAPASDLQEHFDRLKCGKTDLDLVVSMFGKPERDWVASRVHDGKWREMHRLEYPTLGLDIDMLSNPWRLHSVTVTTKEVAVEGLRVGDGLEAVEKRLGDDGKWQTTSRQAGWWLLYESKGLQFGFDRDPAKPKFPKSLATPAVITRIGRFDKKVPYFYQYRRD